MPEFFNTPAGRAVFGVAVALIVILIIEINYRLFFKYLLDFIFGVIAVIVLSPVLIVGAIIYKIEKKPCLGAKGKIVYLHSFAGNAKAIKNLPRLLDIVCGKLSFVGTLAMPASDGALLDDEVMARFGTRPGLFSYLAQSVDENLTYEKMFARDIKYCAKREFFTDIFAVLCCIALLIRGDGGIYLGEAKNANYAQTLIARGVITEAQAQEAVKAAKEAESEDAARKNFRKEKYGKQG